MSVYRVPAAGGAIPKRTWTDETANRSANVIYTNATGYSMIVSVMIGGVGTPSGVLKVDGVVVGQSGIRANVAGWWEPIQPVEVPAGSTVDLTTSGTMIGWLELSV